MYISFNSFRCIYDKGVTIILCCREKDIKAEIEYTGKWKNYSIYTGIAGYALLYFEASKLLGNRDYLDQSFFLVEKCCMHLDGDVLTFLIGDGGPLALGVVCSHLLKQPEKQHHFIHRYYSIIFLSLAVKPMMPFF